MSALHGVLSASLLVLEKYLRASDHIVSLLTSKLHAAVLSKQNVDAGTQTIGGDKTEEQKMKAASSKFSIEVPSVKNSKQIEKNVNHFGSSCISTTKPKAEEGENTKESRTNLGQAKTGMTKLNKDSAHIKEMSEILKPEEALGSRGNS
ncbi:hypothetical protein NDU88_005051 [Pleurodeles waltl]|uniref:Uncharacterized protein n=1 Tax=Pleurodeles waltl TaxID=8319 RepID=A0AAV7NMU5_PLEWA|nr:hypothetical protein NDU88_005051 [Pleurodeles waltl]